MFDLYLLSLVCVVCINLIHLDQSQGRQKSHSVSKVTVMRKRAESYLRKHEMVSGQDGATLVSSTSS